ncbi:MAG: hypothetical protein QGH40_08385, partial [bacterium]|nr:hypothetical protein [bacterium]
SLATWWYKLARGRAVKEMAMAEKETKIFLRNPALLTQLIMLAAITVLYMYNLSVLPLAEVTTIFSHLPALITYLNIAFIAFIISALAVRFVYPSVSLEGKAFWIIQTAPVSMTELILSKFLVYFFPLLLMAGLLSVMATKILHSGMFFAVLSLVDSIFLTALITAINIGVGAVYPHFEAKNAIEIPLSFGGLLTMVLSLAGICLLMLLQSFSIYRVVRYGADLFSIGPAMPVAKLVLFFLSFILCLLCTWGVLLWGIIRLRSYAQ